MRLAKYKDPLFATLTIDPTAGEIIVAGVQSNWLNDRPHDVGYFERPDSAPREVVVPEIRSRTFEVATRR